MDIIICKKGCCKLKILPKSKPQNNGLLYPFEKRKAGVFVCCGNKVLLTQAHNNCWGIPKGHMEAFDSNTKVCAERELKEETGLKIHLNDTDLYRIILDNCYVYRVYVESIDVVNVENLVNLDSTGIGWADLDCAFDFNLNLLTRKILMGTYTS